MSAWSCRHSDGKADPKIVPPRPRIPYWKGRSADSEEKREPVSDIDTAVVDSLKVLDPKRPIREADILHGGRHGCFVPGAELEDYRLGVSAIVPSKRYRDRTLPCRRRENVMKIVLSFVKTATALLMLLVSISAEAAEIRIIGSPGLSAAFEVLGPQFERATGHTLAMQYGLIVVQKQQIEAGAFDLAIVPSLVLDDAIKQGKITADTRTPVARVSVGVGVRANTAMPDLTSTDAFKRALLNAKSVSYVTDEPTGRHIAKEFERLGIADAMKAKTKSQETTTRVWQAVASGEVELGFG